MYNDVIKRLTSIAANDDLTAEQFNAVQDAIIALSAAQQSVQRTCAKSPDGVHHFAAGQSLILCMYCGASR